MKSYIKSISVSILTLSAVLSHAQVTFSAKDFTDGLFYITQNCAVDMNGDMKDDIVGLAPNALYISYQEEDGTFSNKSFRTEFATAADWSICAGDIDGNGFNDLLIGGKDKVSFIYANENGSAYTEVEETEYIFSQRTTFADIDNDGNLDAFICHDEDENHPYRNDGAGNLTLDRELLKTPENVPGNYMASWVDIDNDGDTDMYLTKCVAQAQSGDSARTNLLYINDGTGNYTENGAAANLDDNDQSWVSIFEDFDNDQDFDLVILNHEQANKLMRNNGDGSFTDVITGSGFDASLIGSYEGLAADFDNDGNMDFITDIPQTIHYGNGDLTFRRVDVVAPAGALGDFNSDGFMDILYGRNIFENDANGNNWLRVNTVGTESNRNGLMARVELYGQWGVQTREVRASQSWSPMSTLGIHFGIGQATSIDSVVVKWPSGIKTVTLNPAINQSLVMSEADCAFKIEQLHIDGELKLCPGEFVTLSAPDGYQDFLWSTGDTGPTLQVSETGIYNVSLTATDGCQVFSKNVTVSALEDESSIYTPFGSEFCPGNEATLEVESAYDIVWNTGSTEKVLYTFEEGDYYATIENDCGVQVYTDTITISAFDAVPPVVEDVYVTNPDTNLVVLQVDGAVVIWWTEEDGGDLLFVGNDYFISDFSMDQTFWVQQIHFMDNGTECYSPRVPISVLITSETSDLEQELDLRIFPNPATEILSVSLNSIENIERMQLLDMNGRSVIDRKDNFSLTSKLSIGDLQAGIYVLQISIEDNVISKKVVITE